MIYHVSGRLGSGKTMWCVQKIIETLIFTDREIVTNIRLVDFWDLLLARYVSSGLKSFIKFFISPMPDILSYRVFIAERFAGRYHYYNDLVSAVLYASSGGESNEGSKLFIWDEIHLDLNARDWKKTSGGMIQFFSMSRKLGYDVIMVSQLRSAVDRQMRDLADISYELKNLRNFRIFTLPLAPNIGLLIKRWANKGFEAGGGVFVGAGIVRYGSHVKKFYNTKQLLTDKTVESPKLWVTGRAGSACCKCCYMKFYEKYFDFVDNFYPGRDYKGRDPVRIVHKVYNGE